MISNSNDNFNNDINNNFNGTYLKPNFEDIFGVVYNDNNNDFDNSSNVVNDGSNNLENEDNNKFTITVVEDNSVKNILLNDFNKNTITFGRDVSNDIVISSLLVSSMHGHFEITDIGVKVVDDNSTNGIYVNNNKENCILLKNGDSIKIDNPASPLKKGIIMIFTTGETVNEWQQFDLDSKDSILVGRGDECDIVLNHVSVSLKHAKIFKGNDGFYISNCGSTSGIMVNGVLVKGQVRLKDRDVILIANTKLIYSKGRVLYQMCDRGVKLDAIDIVKTVTVKGKKKDISQHVSLSIKSGQFVAFVGGSGAGKSTFMNCISGVSRPTSGKVLINGNDLFSNYSVLKNIIGYVPQQDIVFTDLTLIDMLKYAANLRMPDDSTFDEKMKRIDEVLEIVELSSKKDVMIKNLSGGQRKRASIAVELIADPKLFFLDEPTSGLDPGTERSIMKTLRKMADSGKTIILVTHNTLNLYLCDKVCFFGEGGRLCFDGKPDDSLKFFEVSDFVDIYTLLNDNTVTWHEKFNKSSYKEKVVVSSTDTVIGKKVRSNKSYFKQFITLSRRYIKTIINNKQQLLLLFIQSPLIAFLLSLIVTDQLFEYYDETKAILFSISTSAVWLGLLNSIQEICKERVILEKEYMANLHLSSYLCSKVVVMGLLAIVQSILLIITFSIFVDVPNNGVIFSWNVETILTIFLTIFSASSIGLVVSVFSKDSSVAMTYAPLLLVPQLLFSGMLFPLEGIVDFVSNFILCRWSVEALGTTNNLNDLVTLVQDVIPGYVRDIEDYYIFTAEHLFNDMGIIVLMTVVLLVTCYFLLKRQLESSR